jgi:hypothetical protein
MNIEQKDNNTNDSITTFFIVIFNLYYLTISI